MHVLSVGVSSAPTYAASVAPSPPRMLSQFECYCWAAVLMLLHGCSYMLLHGTPHD
jgi:hypothetical protein